MLVGSQRGTKLQLLVVSFGLALDLAASQVVGVVVEVGGLLLQILTEETIASRGIDLRPLLDEGTGSERLDLSQKEKLRLLTA